MRGSEGSGSNLNLSYHEVPFGSCHQNVAQDVGVLGRLGPVVSTFLQKMSIVLRGSCWRPFVLSEVIEKCRNMADTA